MNKRNWIILVSALAAWTTSWIVLAAFKYSSGGYNGFDLAIYNNVFWNTVHGHLFASSIHAPSYLGDHAEWMILPLAAIYFFFEHPLTLAILQILALGSGAIPIYLIAKKILAGGRLAIIFPLVWLLNFTVCYNALWEFHLLVFAVPLILWAAYYFIQKKFLPFFIFLLAALLVREDVALAAGGFAALTLTEKKFWQPGEKKKLALWTLIPLAAGALVFLIDLRIITALNPQHHYKYFFYFNSGAPDLRLVAAKIFSLDSLKMVFASLMPFLFLPLRRPRWLILSAPSFLLALAAGSNDWFLPLQTHYLVLALPGLMIASIFGFAALSEDKKTLLPKPLLAPLAVFAPLYCFFALGPAPDLVAVFSATASARAEIRAEQMIPPDASVASSFAPATALSGREKFYYFNYVWFGKNEFGYGDYALPERPDYLLINERFFLAYTIGINNKNDPMGTQVKTGDDRLGALLDQGEYGIVYERDGVALLKKGAGGKYPFFNLLNPAGIAPVERQEATSGIDLVDAINTSDGWTLYFAIKSALPRDLVIKINDEIFPFGQGLWPPDKLRPGNLLEYEYATPADKITFSFFRGNGALNLLRNGSSRFVFNRLAPAGAAIVLPKP